MKVFKRIGVGCLLGFGCGVLMVLPFFHGKGELVGSKTVMAVWEGINTPALWLAHKWTYDAGLGPRGEVAWVLVPVVMILLQWTLIGILAGVWLALKPTRKAGVAVEVADHAAAIPSEHSKQ